MEQTQTTANETLVNLNGSEVKAIERVVDRISTCGADGYTARLMEIVADYAETLRMIKDLPEEPTEQEIQDLKEFADADIDGLVGYIYTLSNTIHLFNECNELWRVCKAIMMQ